MNVHVQAGAGGASGTERLRQQGWRGLKAPVKSVLSLPGVHWAMRTAAARWPRPITVSRLPAPRSVREVSADMAGVSFTMLRPDRCVLAKELYWGEGRRPAAQDQLALDVFARLARGADVTLDIGSYTGIFSLLAARTNPVMQVHAFEVVPAVHAAAWANVVANNLVGQVTVHLRGVGRPGTSATVPTGTGGSALPDFLSLDMAFVGGVDVPVQGLDEFCRHAFPDGAPAMVLVKIDVEGRELDVLEGGRGLLESHRPDMLCEVLPDADDGALTALLLPYGYRFHRVEAERLVESAEIEAHPVWRDWLLTCKPSQELADLGIPVG